MKRPTTYLRLMIPLSVILYLLVICSISNLVRMLDDTQDAIMATLENDYQVTSMAFSHQDLLRYIQYIKIIIGSLLSLLILGLLVGSYNVLKLIRGLQSQETLLRSDIIRQTEATIQAESKNLNKSIAFASGSHDVRTSLVAIMGFIDLCRHDVPQDSDFDRNLSQMANYASKMLGTLNYILDLSKLEAGMMKPAETEFDIVKVLQETTDRFHAVALAKGLKVIWDPCDRSVFRTSNVRGDCSRLKQVLDNLLDNAVKFTSEGHIVIRAWSKKPNIKEFNNSLKHGFRFLNLFNHILKGLPKEEDISCDPRSTNYIQHDSNSLEFIFEVDDTGLGIPKEKRASIFENYVQGNDTTQGGTGLGLAVVRSFVRLMGGDIKILDKEPSDRGTCFWFNIFAKSNDPGPNNLQDEIHPNTVQEEGIQSMHLTQGDETRKAVNEPHSSEIRPAENLKGDAQFTGASLSVETENILLKSSTNELSDPRSTSCFNENDSKPLRGMNILLVEDTKTLRLLATARLSHLGATIECSENGLEALNLIKKALQEATHSQGGSIHFRYDLILMDCEMPIMNGYESTRCIRAEEQQYGYHIPIIALTAHATADEEGKTKQAGMDYHLTKPLQPDTLVEAIRKIYHN